MRSWDDPPHLKGPFTSPDDYDQSDNQPHAGHPRIQSIRANHVKFLSNDASGRKREAIVSNVDLSVPAHNTHVT